MTGHEEALLKVEASRGEGLASSLALKRLAASLSARRDWAAIMALPDALKARLEADPETAPDLLEGLSNSNPEGKTLDAAIALAERLASARKPQAPYGIADARLHLLSRRKGPPYRGPGLSEFAFGAVDADALAALEEGYSAEEGSPSIPVLLVRARALVARREYHQAILAYRLLPGGDDVARLSALLSPGAAQDALLSEAGRAWLNGGGEMDGDALFAALAALPGAAPAGKGQALLAAARCADAAGDRGGAIALFRASHAAAPAGRIKDAAAWYLADAAMSGKGPRDACREILRTMPTWSDGAYFSDVLSSVVSGLVRLRAFSDIEALGLALKTRPGTGLDERIGYIILRASRLGFHKPSAEGAVLGSKAFASPLGYYAILASALEGRDPATTLLRAARGGGGTAVASSTPSEPLASAAAASGESAPSSPPQGAEELAFVRQLIEFGLAAEIPSLDPAILGAIGVADLRSVSAGLYSADRFFESLRLAVKLSSRKDREASPADYALLYPRAFGAEIESAAAEWGLDPALLLGLVRTESAFDPRAVSKSGARGLAQLMPATADPLAASLRMDGADLFEPEDNIALGAAYLSQLKRRANGDDLLAVLCYNGGPTRVMRMRSQSSSLPQDLFLESLEMAETREYGKKVLAAAAIYGYLIEGREFADSVAAFVPGFPIRPVN